METKVLKGDEHGINYACELLKEGKIVALPTDTVYGLGGDCTKSETINEIFAVKGRPQDKPLIVLVSDTDMLEGIVSEFSSDAKALAKAFWPGALTLILPKGEKPCPEVTRGADTIGVRIPNNDVIRSVIRLSHTPLAVPSANISGKPSPTSAEEVLADLGGKIPLILDDGKCAIGVASTIVSLVGTPKILRVGTISESEISKVLGKPVTVE